MIEGLFANAVDENGQYYSGPLLAAINRAVDKLRYQGELIASLETHLAFAIKAYKYADGYMAGAKLQLEAADKLLRWATDVYESGLCHEGLLESFGVAIEEYEAVRNKA